MLDFIPSKYYRNFCEENGIVFSDREKATIFRSCPEVTFGNRMKPEAALYIRLRKLEEIAAATDDGELKAEIEDFKEYYRKKLELLKDNSNKSFIYLVYPRGEQANFFSDYEKAFEAGMSYGKPFSIFKISLGDRVPKAEPNEHGVYFDSNGNLLQFEDVEEIEHDLNNKAIPLKNPFERGDIVMNCYTRQIGVVETSREQWEAKISDPDFEKLSFNSAGLNVDFFSPSGLTFTVIVSPLILEKVENFDQNGDEADLIRCASNILRGEHTIGRNINTLSDFINLYDEIKKDAKIHRILAEKQKNTRLSSEI